MLPGVDGSTSTPSTWAWLSLSLLLQVALLAKCKEQHLPVLSVAGAGAKSDPTRLRIVDLSESSVDPLARAVRHR